MSTLTDVAVIPAMLQGRAMAMANGMGLPIRHSHGDDFSFLAVADAPWDEDMQDFGRWTISLAASGAWVVADAGRWDYLEVHVAPSFQTYANLADALAAVREARQAALAAPA